jgi:ribosomal protein L40E
MDTHDPTPLHPEAEPEPHVRPTLWWHLTYRAETHDGERHTEFQLHDENEMCHAHFHTWGMAQYVTTFLNSTVALDRPGSLQAHVCATCHAAPALLGAECRACFGEGLRIAERWEDTDDR